MEGRGDRQKVGPEDTGLYVTDQCLQASAGMHRCLDFWRLHEVIQMTVLQVSQGLMVLLLLGSLI